MLSRRASLSRLIGKLSATKRDSFLSPVKEAESITTHSVERPSPSKKIEVKETDSITTQSVETLSPPPQIKVKEAESTTTQSVERLPSPPRREVKESRLEIQGLARELLLEIRVSDPTYRPPEDLIRNFYKSSSAIEAQKEKRNRSFTKHEVAKAFDSLFEQTPSVQPDIAQALLDHVSPDSLDELWCHLHDRKLEMKMNRGHDSAFVPRLDNPWLDKVVQVQDLQYIKLMCRAKLHQDLLNRAVGIALKNHWMEVISMLLSFGAVASAFQDIIRPYIACDDIELMKLLISTPSAMSLEALRYCVEPELSPVYSSGKQTPSILLLVLDHRADVACPSLLLQALEHRNLQAAAAILVHAPPSANFSKVSIVAGKAVSELSSASHRFQFLSILQKRGIILDEKIFREELFKDVKERHLPLVKLLVNAGVSVDVEPNHSAYWAVTHLDFDILTLFKDAKFSSSVALILEFVPDSITEVDMLRILTIFAPRGLVEDPLHEHLVSAVRKKHSQLAQSLLQYGASIEHKNALAVQMALKTVNLDLLQKLLQSKCSPTILSTAVPIAMEMLPKVDRLAAMKSLLVKGVLPQCLRIPLYRLVSARDEVDVDLIQLLLHYGAPVDDLSDDAANPVFAAAKMGRLSLLKMLCEAPVYEESVSRALPMAFTALDTNGYQLTLQMIELLCYIGAKGAHMAETLELAIEQDPALNIVRVLLRHGADANHNKGLAFVKALKSMRMDSLELLCEGCAPTATTLAVALTTAIDSQVFQLPALDLLLDLNPGMDSLKTAFTASERIEPRSAELGAMTSLLRQARSSEIGQSKRLLRETHRAINGDIIGLEILLEHKASVDIDDGMPMLTASEEGSIRVLNLLITQKPTVQSLRNACLAASASCKLSRAQKEAVMEILLTAKGLWSDVEFSNLLHDSITALPSCDLLPRILLKRNTKQIVWAILEQAINSCSRNVFIVLFSHVTDIATLTGALRLVRQLEMETKRRFWLCEYLLSRNLPREAVSEVLLQTLQTDDHQNLALPELLLKHGASVKYENGVMFEVVIKAGSTKAIQLLDQHIADDDSRTPKTIFNAVRKMSSLDHAIRFEAYNMMLQRSISEDAIYHALKEHLEGQKHDVSIIRLFLEHGADPNRDKGHCFIQASTTKSDSAFRALSKRGSLSTVLRALLLHYHEEWEVLRWFRICLEEHPHWSVLNYDDEVIFHAIRKFPHGVALVRLLLGREVSASAKLTYPLYPGGQPEPYTVLIWALLEPNVHNEVILALLEHSGLSTQTNLVY
jgi:ankyrin repeat protein